MKISSQWRSTALLTALTISGANAAPDGIDAAVARFGLLGRAVDTAAAYCTKLIGMTDVTTTSTSTKSTKTVVTKTTLPPCTSTVSLASSTVTYSSGTTLPRSTVTITSTIAGSTTTVPGTSVYTPTVTTTVVYTVTSTTSVGMPSNTITATPFKMKRQFGTPQTVTSTAASTTSPACPSGYAASDGTLYSIQCNYNYYGGSNTINMVPNIPSIQSCIEQCELASGCQNVVYYSSGNCYLLANTSQGGAVSSGITVANKIVASTTSASTTAATASSASSSGYCSVSGIPSQFQAGVCAVLSADCSSYISPKTTTRFTTIFPTITTTSTISPRCGTTTLSVTTFTTDVVYTITRPNATRIVSVTQSLATFTSYVTTVTASPTVVTANSTVTVSGSSTVSTTISSGTTTTSASPSSTSSCDSTYTANDGAVYCVHNNYDYSGSSILNAQTGLASVGACAELCEGQNGCNYIDFHSSDGTCLLLPNAINGGSVVTGRYAAQKLSGASTSVITTSVTTTSVTTSSTLISTTTSTISTSLPTSTTTTTTTTTTTLNDVPTGVFIASVQSAPPAQATGPCNGGGQYTEVDQMSNGDLYGLCQGDCLNGGDLGSDAFILSASDPDNACTIFCSSYGGCVAGSVGHFSAGSGPGFCNGQACRVCYLKSSIGQVQNCYPIFNTYYKFSTSQIA